VIAAIFLISVIQFGDSREEMGSGRSRWKIGLRKMKKEGGFWGGSLVKLATELGLR
jgi:hypothetical protein